uniref:Uncharacterized protein n=1 Tax=Knipowitschia caucasica TaxID=637954 RepID=A0AAV2JBE9_KNICA
MQQASQPRVLGARRVQTRATLTPAGPPQRCQGCGDLLCQPWCLLISLTLLFLSLLCSWAVVHLTLGTHGGAPFRIAGGYSQNVPQDDTATIDPHFTTNCTMDALGSLPDQGGFSFGRNSQSLNRHLPLGTAPTSSPPPCRSNPCRQA